MNTSALQKFIPWPPRVTHFGVSLTRIFYAVAILIDMGQVYRWRETSFAGETAWVGAFVVPAAMLALVMFGAGVATRASTLAAALLLRVVYRYLPETYALDSITQLVTFVFLFAPLPRALAVDVWLRKARPQPLVLVPAWFSLALLLCIEVVYANSVLNKLRSVTWHDGTTFWLTMTLPHFSADRLPDALKIPLFLRGATYVALLLETFFPLILVKPLTNWVIFVGVGLHLGIAIFLPIPMFGMGFAALYLCFVDWPALLSRMRPGTAPIDVVPSTAGRSHWPYLLPIFVGVGELAATIPPRIFAPMAQAKPVLAVFGLTNYAVYVDFHFVIPKPIVRVVAHCDDRVVELPTFDERGYPQTTGRYWAMVAIGELRGYTGEAAGDEAFGRFIGARLRQVGAERCELELSGRDVTIPLRLEPSIEQELQRRPWQPLGVGQFELGRVSLQWLPDAPLTTQGQSP